jgi:hypothetical protein
MTLTDEELDRDWQPNGRRPQSTIARSFSAELMDIFRIENSLTDLDQQVHAKLVYHLLTVSRALNHASNTCLQEANGRQGNRRTRRP